MSIHHLECAAARDLPASKKLVLMAFADSAAHDTRLSMPGLDQVKAWAGVEKTRALAMIAELVDDGLLVRVSPGRKGQRAVFEVFPGGQCCALHIGSGIQDPNNPQANIGSDSPDPDASTGSNLPDPETAIGSGKGSGSYRTPSVSTEDLAAAAARSPQVQQLVTAIEAHPQLRKARWSKLTQAQLDEIGRLVEVHGIPAMVAQAIREYRIDNPAVHASAWLGGWRDLVHDEFREPAERYCDEHHLALPCRSCAADAKAASA